MFKLKLNGKDSNLSAVEPGIVDPLHQIPAYNKDGFDSIDLSLYSQWDKLRADQRRFLVEFSKQKMKRKRASLFAGVEDNEVTTWLNTDEHFRFMYDTIIELHVEGIEEVDYLASFDPKNNTSRGRFLDKRSKLYKTGNKEPDKPARIGNQTNVFAILNSPEVSSKGLAGVQQVFNAMKETGKLPEGLSVDQD